MPGRWKVSLNLPSPTSWLPSLHRGCKLAEDRTQFGGFSEEGVPVVNGRLSGFL